MQIKIRDKEIDFNVEEANKKIAELITMQRALDDDIYNKKNVRFNVAKCYMALIDEAGEFTHETKNGWKGLDGTIHDPWCWWKEHLKEPSREKMVEEYIDMWHFAMSIYYHFIDNLGEGDYKEIENSVSLENPIDAEILALNSHYEADDIISFILSGTLIAYIITCMVLLGMQYEIYIDEIVDVYKKKNAINYQRLKEGY